MIKKTNQTKAHKDTVKANRPELKRQNNGGSGALNDALGDALTQQIIEALRKKDTISQSELAEQLQTSRRTIQEQLRRLQIRETILSHIERERQLFSKGIKVLQKLLPADRVLLIKICL